VILEFSERVVDIREQFPLFPLAPIKDVARQRGIRYPLYAQTTVPFVMTTDFVVTVKADDGSVREFARTVKYADELSKGNKLLRTLEKLELERTYWLQRDVDWQIVTEQSVEPVIARNLIWLRGSAAARRSSESYKAAIYALNLSRVLARLATMQPDVMMQMLKSLKLHGMTQALGELAAQDSPAYKSASLVSQGCSRQKSPSARCVHSRARWRRHDSANGLRLILCGHRCKSSLRMAAEPFQGCGQFLFKNRHDSARL
jgi:TnsA endonuclease N terminal